MLLLTTQKQVVVLLTENAALTGSQVLGELASGDTVTFAGETPFGVAATGNTYTSDGEGGFTYATTVATGSSADISAAIVPSTGSISATYELDGGNTIDSEGTITVYYRHW